MADDQEPTEDLETLRAEVALLRAELAEARGAGE
jgi:hypothetical protein